MARRRIGHLALSGGRSATMAAPAAAGPTTCATRRHHPADTGLPPFAPGMRIGLFGGSFDPPHSGHRHASLIALTRLRLDKVWWLVTPGNPLKDISGLAPQLARMAAAAALAHHPRLGVTGVEAQIGSRFTFDTLRWLRRRCPGVRFVWIMGADNLAGFHRWQHWREIAKLMPIAIIARPGSLAKGPLGKAARVLAGSRLAESEAWTLASCKPPAWTFLHAPLDATSSTLLRAQGRGVADSGA